MFYEFPFRTGPIIIHGLKKAWLQGEACIFLHDLLCLKIDTVTERNFGSKNNNIIVNFLVSGQYFRM